MVKPRKRRKISRRPVRRFYKPAGIPMKNLQLVTLNFEEVEALRLKNLEGLNNHQAAQRMEISRATFQRILKLAYRKLALGLVYGRAIQIEGGHYLFSQGMRGGRGSNGRGRARRG
jgi:uncharacterized protein